MNIPLKNHSAKNRHSTMPAQRWNRYNWRLKLMGRSERVAQNQLRGVRISEAANQAA